MKKIFIFAFCIILILTSCTTDKKEVNSKSSESKEVTIAVWEDDYDFTIDLSMPIIEYISKYNKDNDTRVKFDKIKGNTYEEFLDNLNVKLYLDEGPTLIYISNMPYFYQLFKEKGIAEKVDTDTISNLNNVYDFYLEDEIYFIPIGADYTCKSFNKEQIEKLDIPYPDYDWTIEDYYEIRNKWVDYTKPIEFSRDDIQDIIIYKLDNIDVFSQDNKKINLDTKQMKENINNMREEIYSDKYTLPENFTYEDYYNACFDYHSFNKGRDFLTRSATIYYLTFDAYNALNVESLKRGMMDDRIHFPNVNNQKYNIDLGGFIVNSNGKNKKLGYEFINSLLSKEFQMQMYKGEKQDYVLPSNMYSPVLKTLKDNIQNIESKKNLQPEVIKIKNYIYDKLKKGEIKPEIYRKDKTLKTVTLRRKLYKDLFKFIFTEDVFSDDSLSRELKELEDRYSIYLNE